MNKHDQHEHYITFDMHRKEPIVSVATCRILWETVKTSGQIKGKVRLFEQEI